MAILFTLRVFARNQLRGNRRRNTFRILLAYQQTSILIKIFATLKFLSYLLNWLLLPYNCIHRLISASRWDFLCFTIDYDAFCFLSKKSVV